MFLSLNDVKVAIPKELTTTSLAGRSNALESALDDHARCQQIANGGSRRT